MAAAPQAGKKAPPKKPVSGKAAGASTSTARSSGAKKKSTVKASSKRRPSVRRQAPTWRNSQRQPSRERYAEIEQALAARGYFGGEPKGEWSAESVEALKRFQADQKLAADGRINSMSLIALGLGPKRAQNSLP